MTRLARLLRLLWIPLNLVQALFTAAWSIVWISLALVVRVATGGIRAPLWMARHVWSPGLLWGAGARVRVEGLERIDLDRAHLFVASHSSQIDIPVLFVAIPRPVCFIVKRELATVPFLGWYLRATDMVFLDRRDRGGAYRSVVAAREQLENGRHVVAFPEGTRSRDGHVRPFKPGAFLAAIEAGVDVVPVAVDGAAHVLPVGGFAVRPGVIRVVVGEPIPTAGMEAADRQRLAAASREAVVELLGGPSPPAPLPAPSPRPGEGSSPEDPAT